RGDDTITGTTGSNRLRGGGGADFIYGQSVAGDTLGGAYLQAASGGDWIEGEAGADRLQGGAGNDTLYGGSSAASGPDDQWDLFAFAARGNGVDRIMDLSPTDGIQVSAALRAGYSSRGDG